VIEDPLVVGGVQDTVTADAVAREKTKTGRLGTSRGTVEEENGDQEDP
jgi:hypothetical protein